MAINGVNSGLDLVSSLTDNLSSGRDRVLAFYGDFKSEMATMMMQLLDDDSDLYIGGVKIDSENKTGTAATYMLSEWQSEQDFVFSQLLDSYKFEQTLENKLNNISFT